MSIELALRRAEWPVRWRRRWSAWRSGNLRLIAVANVALTRLECRRRIDHRLEAFGAVEVAEQAVVADDGVWVAGVAEDLHQGAVEELGRRGAEAVELGGGLGRVAVLVARHQEGGADQHEQHEQAEHDEQQDAAARSRGAAHAASRRAVGPRLSTLDS